MTVIAFVMQKGGSGKSTLATQLAAHAQQKGERALIVDLDPQRSAVVWSGIRASKAPEAVPCLPQRLAEVVKQAQQSFGKTLIIIDTAPHSDTGALEAMAVADIIVCPTKASVFDRTSMKDTIGLLDHADAKGRAMVVLNDINPKGAAATYDEAVDFLKDFNVRVCTTFVCHRAHYVTAIGEGKGVTEMKAKDAQAAAGEIQRLYKEIITRQPAAAARETAQ